MRTSSLRELARQYSIETEYIDAAGVKQRAGRDALVAAIEKRAGASIETVAERPRETRVVEDDDDGEVEIEHHDHD